MASADLNTIETIPDESGAGARTALERPVTAGVWLPALTLWWRELVRFYRQKARVVGVIGSPVVFWFVIGSGFGRSFQPAAGKLQSGYLEYFFPGTVVLILLFTSIFTMMSVIEDRQEGFLLSVLVAPCARVSIALGKIFGGATLAAAQGLVFTLLAPTLGIHLSVATLLSVVAVLFLIGFGLTGLGFLVAWRMDSTHAFHAIVNLFLIPAWLVSGALFPLSTASAWLRWVMLLNPLTYGTEALRAALYWNASRAAISPGLSLVALSGFNVVVLALSLWLVSVESRRKAA